MSTCFLLMLTFKPFSTEFKSVLPSSDIELTITRPLNLQSIFLINHHYSVRFIHILFLTHLQQHLENMTYCSLQRKPEIFSLTLNCNSHSSEVVCISTKEVSILLYRFSTKGYRIISKYMTS